MVFTSIINRILRDGVSAITKGIARWRLLSINCMVSVQFVPRFAGYLGPSLRIILVLGFKVEIGIFDYVILLGENNNKERITLNKNINKP